MLTRLVDCGYLLLIGVAMSILFAQVLSIDVVSEHLMMFQSFVDKMFEFVSPVSG